MGLLVNGQWQDKWYDTKSTSGNFQREQAKLRNFISPRHPIFKPEANRYHLYVSLACPWAHRTLIFRELKKLHDVISVSIVSPDMLENGWTFSENSTGDHLFNSSYLHQIYTKHDNTYSGRVTVPVLWDKKQNCIVNNESAEIIRMFNSEFNRLTGDTADYYPKDLQSDINKLNALIYENINNGVYRCGFATTQSAYEQAFTKLFACLQDIEDRLASNKYLLGEQLTEADWRLFTTLVRFDCVYFGHFKCNLKHISSYTNLANYLRQLYHFPGIRQTVNFYHIKRHYYFSHTMINPTQVVPIGPDMDYLLSD